MNRTRRRRRLFLVVLLVAGVAAVMAYRDRALRRNASEFVEQYGG